MSGVGKNNIRVTGMFLELTGTQAWEIRLVHG